MLPVWEKNDDDDDDAVLLRYIATYWWKIAISYAPPAYKDTRRWRWFRRNIAVTFDAKELETVLPKVKKVDDIYSSAVLTSHTII